MNEELNVSIKGRIPPRAGTWSVRAGNVTRKFAVLLFAIMLLGTVTDRRRDGRVDGAVCGHAVHPLWPYRCEHVRRMNPLGKRRIRE
jgi:hypothetical protein